MTKKRRKEKKKKKKTTQNPTQETPKTHPKSLKNKHPKKKKKKTNKQAPLANSLFILIIDGFWKDDCLTGQE
jgi:hypothetical protein